MSFRWELDEAIHIRTGPSFLSLLWGEKNKNKLHIRNMWKWLVNSPFEKSRFKKNKNKKSIFYSNPLQDVSSNQRDPELRSSVSSDSKKEEEEEEEEKNGDYGCRREAQTSLTEPNLTFNSFSFPFLFSPSPPKKNIKRKKKSCFFPPMKKMRLSSLERIKNDAS